MNPTPSATSNTWVPISDDLIASFLPCTSSGWVFVTSTHSRVNPSSGSDPILTSARSGNLCRTIRPTVAPEASSTGSTSLPPGISTAVTTVGPPTSYDGSSTSHSTASSQLSTDCPSTVISATGR